MLASMFKKRVPTSASKPLADGDGESANTSAPAALAAAARSSTDLPRSSSESSVISNLLHAHPNLSVFRNSIKANRSLPSSTPNHSPTPNRPRAQTSASRSTTPQRPSMKGLFLQRNHSMESLGSPGRSSRPQQARDEGEDTFFTPDSKGGRTPDKENGLVWQRSPTVTKQTTGNSPYLSPYKASKSSPDVSNHGLSPPAPEDAFYSFHHVESVPTGTPISKKGILRDPGRGSTTPATGSSVRFFSRDNVHIISPDTTTSEYSSPASSLGQFDGPALMDELALSQMDNESEAEDLSMATGMPTLSSSITYHDDPSAATTASLRTPMHPPTTPLHGPVSRSFLDRLHEVSPATPDDCGDLTIGMLALNKATGQSSTPTRASSSARRPSTGSTFAPLHPSPLTANVSVADSMGTAHEDESHISTLLSLDMLNPPTDMSNLRDTTDRLPVEEEQATVESPSDAGASSRASVNSPMDDLPTPASTSFPYQDLESSTATQRPVGEKSDPGQPPLEKQSSFSSMLDLYSHSPASPPGVAPPLSRPPSDDAVISSTPRKALPVPDSCGDLTVYHTPRADLQLRILQIEMESLVEGCAPLNRSPFNPEASFSRSIVDRGISPGQPGSPSVILSFTEGDSFDYAPSSPITPSLMDSFPRAPSSGQQVLVPITSPSTDIVALNSDFYQSHQHLLAVTQQKYDLQLQISKELEAALRRKEHELRAVKAQMDRMGEVRDLEVRLEMQRFEAAQARDALQVEVDLKEQALALAAETQKHLDRAEGDVRDLEIKGVGAASPPFVLESASPSPHPSEVVEVTRVDRAGEVALLETQVAEQLAEIKRLAARLVDTTVEKDAALGQVSALEQDAIADALKLESLEGKVADCERIIERLEGRLEASSSESLSQLESILASHHQQTSELNNEIASLRAQVGQASTTAPATSPQHETEVNVLVVALAAARRDLRSLTEQAGKDAHLVKVHQEELDHQWTRAEEMQDDLAKLKQHRDQLVESLAQADGTTDTLQADITALLEERDSLLAEVEALIAERDDALAGRAKGEGGQAWAVERDDLVAERDTVLAERDAAWEEREELLAQLNDRARELADKVNQFDELTRSVELLHDRHRLELEEHDRVRDTQRELASSKEHYVAKATSLQDQLNEVNATVSTKSTQVASLQSRLDELESSMRIAASDARLVLEEACHARDKKIRALQHALKEQARKVEELERERADMSHRFNGLVAEHASRSVELQTSSFRSVAESGELERLTKQIAQLKAEDAAKEVRILHLVRSRDEVRETLEGVEIALDSKQQELELVKRKFGVKGVGGCTPAPNRSLSSSSASVSRRHPLAPATPSVSSSLVLPRASLGNASLVPETPVPLPKAGRPRSSLAMGTPGLKHVPNASRPPRSSLDVSGTAPTPSAASRPGRLSASRLPQESPAPSSTAAARQGRLSTSMSSAARPLSNSQTASSNATPRRTSLAPVSTTAKPLPVPRRSLSGLATPFANGKRLSLGAHGAPQFPSVDGVRELHEEDTGNKENDSHSPDALLA